MNKLSRLFLVIVLFLTACGTRNPGGIDNPIGQQDFPTDLLLTAQELPDGFVRQEFLRVDVPNANALAIGFAVPDGSQFPAIRVSQRLAIYANEQSAQAAYPDWDKVILTGAWELPGDFHFKPTTSGDLYHYGCLPGSTNGKSLTDCVYIQRHNNKIWEVFANLDGKIFKLEDLAKILKSLDARISQAK